MPASMIEAFVTIGNGAVLDSRHADRIVPWWSFTKTVLAAAALTLVRDGKLALDAPLPGQPFTLRQLLQHRAGLPDYGGLAEYHAAVARGDPPWDDAELLARCDAARLRYPPGAGWAYSNVGYLFVRNLIAQADGRGLAAALQDRVLAPLGIAQVRLAETPDDLAGVTGVADGYHPGWVCHGLLVGPLQQAGSLLHRLLNGSLLPPGLLRQMRQPHPLDAPGGDRPWAAAGYGLGLMIGRSSAGGMLEGHTGGGPESAIAVYRVSGPGAARISAAFAPGDSAAAVEAFAFGLAGSLDMVR